MYRIKRERCDKCDSIIIDKLQCYCNGCKKDLHPGLDYMIIMVYPNAEENSEHYCSRECLKGAHEKAA